MKGSSFLMWVAITVIITLMIVTFAAKPISNSVDEAIRLSAKLKVQEIAGILNTLQSSPDSTCHSYSIPKGKLEIRQKFVRMTENINGKDEVFWSGILQTNVIIEDKLIDADKEMNIYFLKKDNKITVETEQKPECK